MPVWHPDNKKELCKNLDCECHHGKHQLLAPRCAPDGMQMNPWCCEKCAKVEPKGQ